MASLNNGTSILGKYIEYYGDNYPAFDDQKN